MVHQTLIHLQTQISSPDLLTDHPSHSPLFSPCFANLLDFNFQSNAQKSFLLNCRPNPRFMTNQCKAICFASER